MSTQSNVITLTDNKVWYVEETIKVYKNRQTIPSGTAVFETKYKAVKCYNNRIREYESKGWKAEKHWSAPRVVTLTKEGSTCYINMSWGEYEIGNTENLLIIQ